MITGDDMESFGVGRGYRKVLTVKADEISRMMADLGPSWTEKSHSAYTVIQYDFGYQKTASDNMASMNRS